ncbi:unnamed protein product, partial [marine sediment metagenome]
MIRESKPLKILFVGVVDIFWSDHIPMVKALKKQGHNVSVFNLRTIAIERRLINNSSWLFRQLEKLKTKTNIEYRQNPDDDITM